MTESMLAEAKTVLSQDTARYMICCSWPLHVCIRAPVWAFHTLTR